MHSLREEQFYKALGQVPPVPDYLGDTIANQTGHAFPYRKVLLAASLILAVLIPGLLWNKLSSPAYADNKETMEELLTCCEYLNGSDLLNETSDYLFVDNQLSSFFRKESSNED